MDSLTPDSLYSVALKMRGGDLMKLCSTDQRTRRICTSEKFNPIWTQKLAENFNVQYSGNNSYMEYLQHTYLYKQTYWVATIFNKNDGYIVASKIFKNNEDGAAFLANEQTKYISRNPQYGKPKFYEIFASLKELGYFEDRWNKYEITESEFETKSQASKGYNNYISKLKKLYDLISSSSSDSNGFKKFREEFDFMIAEKSESFETFKDILNYLPKNEFTNKQLTKIEEVYYEVLEGDGENEDEGDEGDEGDEDKNEDEEDEGDEE